MSAEIIAVPFEFGDNDFPGPRFVQLQIVAIQPIAGNPGVGVISSPLSSDKEVDYAVAHLIKEAKKAGSSAKKILSSSKGGKK